VALIVVGDGDGSDVFRPQTEEEMRFMGDCSAREANFQQYKTIHEHTVRLEK